jgi:hypothetical protein
MTGYFSTFHLISCPCYMPVFCLFTLDRQGNFTAGVTMEQPDLLIKHLILFCRQALFLHLGQMGSLFLFIKVAQKIIPQIIEVFAMSGEVVLLSLDRSFNKVQHLLGLFSLRLSSSSIIFFLKSFNFFFLV